MKAPSPRYLALCVLLALTAAATLWIRAEGDHGVRTVDLATRVPLALGKWQGRDHALEPGTQALLGASNVLLRTYESEGEPDILLSISLAAGGHRAIHPAEICYEGQGWTVTREGETALDLGAVGIRKVDRFRVAKSGRRDAATGRPSGGDRRRLVGVWYLSASGWTPSFGALKYRVLLDHLVGRNSWSAMVRLSSALGPEGEAPLLDAWSRFGAELVPAVEALSRELDAP